MRNLIVQIVRSELSEYADKISEQEKDITELTRRLNNMNRVGVITDISPDQRRIKVRFGRNFTPFIKWVSESAGRDATYRPPTVGEEVLLINVGGGDNSATSFAIRGIPSDDYPLPSANPDEFHWKLPDNTHIKYNHKQHHLSVTMNSGTALFKVPEKITLDTALVYCTGHIKADGDITDHTRSMQDDREIYNGHTHRSPETSAPTSEPLMPQ